MYLHCHNCHWSQSDFYSKSYNPFTIMWGDIQWLIKPRMTSLDIRVVDDLIEYTHIPIVLIHTSKARYSFFSWNWLILEFVKNTKNFLRQKYWTYESYKKAKDKGTAKCPKCKSSKHFDID